MGCRLRSGGFLSLLRCGFTTVTGPLRIQLTCRPDWLLVVFVVSGSFQCINVFSSCVVVNWDRRYSDHDWSVCVWGCDSLVCCPLEGRWFGDAICLVDVIRR